MFTTRPLGDACKPTNLGFRQACCSLTSCIVVTQEGLQEASARALGVLNGAADMVRVEKILIVTTSQATLGDTEEPTGVW